MAPTDNVEIGRDIIGQLITRAAAAHPDECCGLLLGHGRTITIAAAAANVHPAPHTHFAIDPAALIAAHRAARAGGPQVIGYYHSHPRGPAQPSATDRAQSAGDGRVWAIIGGGGGNENPPAIAQAQVVRFWRDGQSSFTELSHCAIAR